MAQRSLDAWDKVLAEEEATEKEEEEVREWAVWCVVLRSLLRLAAGVGPTPVDVDGAGAEPADRGTQVLKDLQQLLEEQGRDNLSFEQRIAQVRRVVVCSGPPHGFGGGCCVMRRRCTRRGNTARRCTSRAFHRGVDCPPGLTLGLTTAGRQFEKLEALYAGNGKHVAAAIFHNEADHCRRRQRQMEAAASTRRAKEEEETRKEARRLEKLKQISECALRSLYRL